MLPHCPVPVKKKWRIKHHYLLLPTAKEQKPVCKQLAPLGTDSIRYLVISAQIMCTATLTVIAHLLQVSRATETLSWFKATLIWRDCTSQLPTLISKEEKAPVHRALLTAGSGVVLETGTQSRATTLGCCHHSPSWEGALQQTIPTFLTRWATGKGVNFP